MTWDNATATCDKWGGRLFILLDIHDEDVLKHVVAEAAHTTGMNELTRLWLGGFREDETSAWKWYGNLSVPSEEVSRGRDAAPGTLRNVTPMELSVPPVLAPRSDYSQHYAPQECLFMGVWSNIQHSTWLYRASDCRPNSSLYYPSMNAIACNKIVCPLAT
jgi:hypothetical protein